MSPPVAIITGAGSGIGRAAALALGGGGYRVALVGRTEARVEEAAAEVARCCRDCERALAIHIDLLETNAAEIIITRVKSKWERIDALVNNAGVAKLRPIAETDMGLLEQMFRVNTFAPALLIARAWPIMMSQEPLADAPSPCIVNVSTAATFDPFPGLCAYAASKCALESYVRSIVNERGDFPIRAFAVAPGAVETPMLRGLFSEDELPPDRTIAPERVAEVIVECIRGERDDQIGEVIRLSP